MKRKILVLIAVLLILGLVGWYFWSQQQNIIKKGAADEAEKFTVTKTKLTETLTLSGKIDADEHVSLFFPTGGKLAWVGVKEGDFVKQYQGLASIDQRDLEKRLQSSLNSFMISRWDFDQTKQDNKDAQYKDGDLGDKLKRIIDKSQFSLDNAIINVELQSLAKEMAYMYSPIEGIVTKVGGQFAGANISAASTFEIVNPQTIYFSATADQTEVPLLTVGETVRIILDPYEDETKVGVVKSIAFTPKAGDTGTTYEIKIEFSSSNDLLKYRMGMTGDAEFVIKEKRGVYAVPLNFVKTEAKEKVVYKLLEGKETRTVVLLGDEGDDSVEVKTGVKEGDVLIVKK